MSHAAHLSPDTIRPSVNHRNFSSSSGSRASSPASMHSMTRHEPRSSESESTVITGFTAVLRRRDREHNEQAQLPAHGEQG